MTVRSKFGITKTALPLLIGAALSPALPAQAQQSYHGRRVWPLQNGKMKVLIAPGGGHIASMTLNSGRGSGLNPLWLPPWKSTEPGRWRQSGGYYGDPPGAQLLSTIMGHNICVDFFGSPSAPETAAGLSAHGEAPAINWTLQNRTQNRITYATTLPHAQMRVSRTVTLVPNSTALWIQESVTNLSALDRPFGWQQHPTMGPPFLAAGETFFDMPATWSIVYPKEFSTGERLRRGAQFQWPDAPGSDGDTVDLRSFPPSRPNSDYTASIIDPSRQWGYFTAINPRRGLLIGYVWPRKDWPWVGNWEENRFRSGNPWRGKAVARGFEFGTTPFPDSRRDAVTMAKLHNTPTYRWISAKAKQTVGYGAFLAPVPPGATGVRDVQVEGNRIRIELAGVDRTIFLPVRRQ